MGQEFTVIVWNTEEDVDWWLGDSFMEAIVAMEEARKEGFKCIKLEWRPLT